MFLVSQSVMEGILQQNYPDVYAIMFPCFLWGIQWIGNTASVFMILTIAIERYYAVHYPQNYKTKDPERVMNIVYCVSFLAFILTVSKFFEAWAQGKGLSCHEYLDNCETQLGCDIRAAFAIKVKDTVMFTEMSRNQWYQLYDTIIFKLLITLVIPFVTLIVLYYKIYQRIRATQSSVLSAIVIRSKSSKRKMKKEVDHAKVFAGFVISFLISRTPSVAFYLTSFFQQRFGLAGFGDQSDGHEIVPLHLWSKIVIISLIPLLASINSATNVLIYASVSKQFRRECRKYFANILRIHQDEAGYLTQMQPSRYRANSHRGSCKNPAKDQSSSHQSETHVTEL